MKQRLFALLLALAALLALPGCRGRGPELPEDLPGASIQYATEDPEDLNDVLDLIYEEIDMKGLSDADDDDLLNLFHIDPDLVEDYAVRFSSGRYGVADVAIIRPAGDTAQAVQEALEQRRSDRTIEFENYDIHDSLRIARDADVFTRGSYVIMLMVDDLEAARTVILEQIPG